jgi:hypothetical protein
LRREKTGGSAEGEGVKIRGRGSRGDSGSNGLGDYMCGMEERER